MKSIRVIKKGYLANTCLVLLLIVSNTAIGQKLKLDERPAEPGEWDYRPAAGSVSRVNPPSFSWRPQKDLTWEVTCVGNQPYANISFHWKDIEFNVYCPSETFPVGTYTWKYRGKDKKDRYTNWSQPRTFTIADDASKMPMPTRKDLIGRIPKSHPRLFMRPENLGRLRELAKGKMKMEYEELVRDCERIITRPPSTKEPRKYPKGTIRNSDAWREIWWGNRTYTIRALNSAATLAFTRLLGGQEKYGLEAKRILMGTMGLYIKRPSAGNQIEPTIKPLKEAELGKKRTSARCR